MGFDSEIQSEYFNRENFLRHRSLLYAKVLVKYYISRNFDGSAIPLPFSDDLIQQFHRNFVIFILWRFIRTYIQSTKIFIHLLDRFLLVVVSRWGFLQFPRAIASLRGAIKFWNPFSTMIRSFTSTCAQRGTPVMLSKGIFISFAHQFPRIILFP